MIIKKLKEEITYQEKNETHTFLINGKEIRIHTHDKQDNETNDYEVDQEINQRDIKNLTVEESEEIEELITDVLDTKEGEEWDSEKLPVTVKK